MEINKLVEKIKQGNAKAFDSLYERMRKAVYYTAYAVLRDHGEAENIMQDAFVSFYQSLDRLLPHMNAGSYLLTIARNLAINRYHREKRMVGVSDEALDALETRTERAGEGILDIALSVLDERSFRVLTLCAIEGYKRREVAELLELPIGTVTWIYRRAVERVRREYEKEGR